MTDLFPPVAFCPDERAEALLNEYVDGELDTADEPEFFAHLAACGECRQSFSTFLAFRMAVRAEPLAVPPAADAALFARLDRLRAQPMPDRAADRAPLGGALRHRVSVGAALVLAAVAVAFGVLASPAPSAEPGASPPTYTVLADGALYMLGPELTVEAEAPLR